MINKRSSTLTRKVVAFVMLMITFSGTQVYGGVPKWFTQVRQIIPLVTTRAEIERSLKPAGRDDNPIIGKVGKTVEYSSGPAMLSITYSHGSCRGYIDIYRVEPDVVLDVDVVLKKPVPFSELGLDVRTFRKETIPDVVGIFTYVDLEKGERFNGSNTALIDFERFPNAKLESLYRCKDSEIDRSDLWKHRGADGRLAEIRANWNAKMPIMSVLWGMRKMYGP